MLNEIFTLFSLVCASGSLIFLSIDFFSISIFFCPRMNFLSILHYIEFQYWDKYQILILLSGSGIGCVFAFT